MESSQCLCLAIEAQEFSDSTRRAEKHFASVSTTLFRTLISMKLHHTIPFNPDTRIITRKLKYYAFIKFNLLRQTTIFISTDRSFGSLGNLVLGNFLASSNTLKSNSCNFYQHLLDDIVYTSLQLHVLPLIHILLSIVLSTLIFLLHQPVTSRYNLYHQMRQVRASGGFHSCPIFLYRKQLVREFTYSW